VAVVVFAVGAGLEGVFGRQRGAVVEDRLVHGHRAGEVLAVGEPVAVVVGAVPARFERVLGTLRSGARAHHRAALVVAVDEAVVVVVDAVLARAIRVLAAHGDEAALAAAEVLAVGKP